MGRQRGPPLSSTPPHACPRRVSHTRHPARRSHGRPPPHPRRRAAAGTHVLGHTDTCVVSTYSCPAGPAKCSSPRRPFQKPGAGFNIGRYHVFAPVLVALYGHHRIGRRHALPKTSTLMYLHGFAGVSPAGAGGGGRGWHSGWARGGLAAVAGRDRSVRPSAIAAAIADGDAARASHKRAQPTVHPTVQPTVQLTAKAQQTATAQPTTTTCGEALTASKAPTTATLRRRLGDDNGVAAAAPATWRRERPSFAMRRG